LTERILTAVILIPLVIFISWVGNLPFFIMIVSITLVAQWEFYEIAQRSVKISPKKGLSLFTGFLILLSTYLRTPRMLLSSQKGIPAFVLTMTIALILFSHLLSKNIRYFLESFGVSLAGIFMIPWFASYIILLRDIHPCGINYFFFLLFGVWIVDTFAFLFGTKFGKKKLARIISPKKTIVGAVAGFFGGIIFAFAWQFFSKLDFLKTKDLLIMGFIIGVFGQIGDLIESMVKRAGVVKDSGSIFPGHGGAYDRIDSLIFAAPFLYYYIVFFIR